MFISPINFQNFYRPSFSSFRVPKDEREFFDGQTPETIKKKYIRLEGSKIVGKNYLKDNDTGENLPVVITKEHDNIFNRDLYQVYALLDRGESVRLGHVYLQRGKKSVFMSGMKSYYPRKMGIGTLLHQIAIEKSFKEGYDGYVSLFTAYKAEAFHYKNGYRICKIAQETGDKSDSNKDCNKLNDYLDSVVTKAKNEGLIIPEKALSSVCYFKLSHEGRKYWIDKIDKAPILVWADDYDKRTPDGKYQGMDFVFK